jgi:hypothetical protein
MRTDSPPVRFAPEGPGGYGRGAVDAEERLTHAPDRFTRAQASPSAPIFEVPCGGVGVAAYGHLRGRPLRRAYAGAKMCRVRQEGLSLQTTSRTHSDQDLGQPLRVTKGEGCALKNQESLFPAPQNQPTVDSIYLARQIAARWHASLTPAAIQTLVSIYGPSLVEDKLRELHGFPPEEAIREPYAYLATMLRENL